MPIKKPNVTYAELYVRDLLIERDSASFYRNLITQFDVGQSNGIPGYFREWAKLDEGADSSATDWLPSCDPVAEHPSEPSVQRLSFWMALNVAVSAESKAKLYYEGALKRTIDPAAQALAEKRVAERLHRIEYLREVIKALQPDAETPSGTTSDAAESPVPAWVQARIASCGNIRFVHSEPV